MADTELRYIVRVAGTDLKGTKPLLRALTTIRGISFMMARAIVRNSGFDGKKEVGAFSEEEIKKLEDIILNPDKLKVPDFIKNRRKDTQTGKNTHLVGVDLGLAEKHDIELMKKIKSYKGVRHGKGLKVRGQRTKSTGRGGATIGVSRKKVQQKAKKKKEGG